MYESSLLHSQRLQDPTLQRRPVTTIRSLCVTSSISYQPKMSTKSPSDPLRPYPQIASIAVRCAISTDCLSAHVADSPSRLPKMCQVTATILRIKSPPIAYVELEILSSGCFLRRALTPFQAARSDILDDDDMKDLPKSELEWQQTLRGLTKDEKEVFIKDVAGHGQRKLEGLMDEQKDQVIREYAEDYKKLKEALKAENERNKAMKARIVVEKQAAEALRAEIRELEAKCRAAALRQDEREQRIKGMIATLRFEAMERGNEAYSGLEEDVESD